MPHQVNRISRAAYAEARGRKLAGADDTDGRGQYARHAGAQGTARSRSSLRPPGITTSTSISHLALGMHGLYFLNQPQRAQVAELRDTAPAIARGPPTGAGSRPGQRSPARSVKIIFDEARPLADRERAAGPLLLANALDAARSEMDDLDAAVKSVRLALGDQGFARLHVIVVARAHGARRRGAVRVPLSACWASAKARGSSSRKASGTSRAISTLLGTHLIDASVGAAFSAMRFACIAICSRTRRRRCWQKRDQSPTWCRAQGRGAAGAASGRAARARA